MLKSFHILLTAWKKISFRRDETQNVPPQKEYFWRSYEQMEIFSPFLFLFPNLNVFCTFHDFSKDYSCQAP